MEAFKNTTQIKIHPFLSHNTQRLKRCTGRIDYYSIHPFLFHSRPQLSSFIFPCPLNQFRDRPARHVYTHIHLPTLSPWLHSHAIIGNNSVTPGSRRGFCLARRFSSSITCLFSLPLAKLNSPGRGALSRSLCAQDEISFPPLGVFLLSAVAGACSPSLCLSLSPSLPLTLSSCPVIVHAKQPGTCICPWVHKGVLARA